MSVESKIFIQSPDTAQKSNHKNPQKLSRLVCVPRTFQLFCYLPTNFDFDLAKQKLRPFTILLHFMNLYFGAGGVSVCNSVFPRTGCDMTLLCHWGPMRASSLRILATFRLLRNKSAHQKKVRLNQEIIIGYLSF